MLLIVFLDNSHEEMDFRCESKLSGISIKALLYLLIAKKSPDTVDTNDFTIELVKNIYKHYIGAPLTLFKSDNFRQILITLKDSKSVNCESKFVL